MVTGQGNLEVDIRQNRETLFNRQHPSTNGKGSLSFVCNGKYQNRKKKSTHERTHGGKERKRDKNANTTPSREL